MPYKSDKFKINNEKLDRRVKIQKSQYEEIREKYIAGGTYRGLAREYGCDRKTIKMIVYPEFKNEMLESNKKRSADYRERLKTDSELKKQRNKQMQEHRKYKHDLYNRGLIKHDENK